MKKWIIGILVVFFIFAAYMAGEESAPKQTVVQELSNVAYTQIERGMIYKATELTVVDVYAESTENGKTVETYYLVVFRDANNRLVAASMPSPDDFSASIKLSFYASSDSMYIGDCVLDCYVKASRVSESTTNQAKLEEFFAEAVSDYTEVFGEPLYPMEYQLDYYCNIEEDPLAK